jgi:UPF0716 protein FxsA
MPLFLLIILAFPIAEITLLSMLASHIGVFGMLLYLIASALLGSWMLRNQKLGALLTMGSLMRQGEGISIYSLLWPLRYALAGVLFILPGILSELAGVVLLLPLKGPALKATTTGQGPMPPDEDVIEGEFQRVDEPRPSIADPSTRQPYKPD